MPFFGKFRLAKTAARFSQPPQYIRQNERLGRECAAISFLAATRYHVDVIRPKPNRKSAILTFMPFFGKFRLAKTAARFSQPPQYIRQNERLARECAAISFLADSRYHGDVIRKKRRQKTPLTLHGGDQTETLSPHYSGILLPSNMISTVERSQESGLQRPIGTSYDLI